MAYSEETKAEAVRLRSIERKSFDEISREIGIPKPTLMGWLREYPLTPDEILERRRKNIGSGKALANSQDFPAYSGTRVRSALSQMSVSDLTTDQKGHISETAVELRLRVLGYEIWHPDENSKIDLLVRRSKPEFTRIQVKTARIGNSGRPYVDFVTSRNGRRNKNRYNGVCDVIVGYDLFEDAAYVFLVGDLKDRSAVTCSVESREKWELLEK